MSKITLNQWNNNKPSLLDILKVTLNIYQELQKKGSHSFISITNDILIDNSLSVQMKKSQYNTRSNKHDQEIYNKQYTSIVYFIIMLMNKPHSLTDFLIQKQNEKKVNSNIWQFLLQCEKNKYYSIDKTIFIQKLKQIIRIEQQNSKIITIIYKLQQMIEFQKFTKQEVQTQIKKLNNINQNNNWKILNTLGVAYYLYKNYDQAMKNFQQAQRLSKNNPIIINNKACLHYLSRKLQLYYQQCKNLSKCQNVSIDEIRQHEAMAFLKNKEYQNTLKIYNNFIQKFSGYKKAKYLMKVGQVHIMKGDNKKALQFFKKADTVIKNEKQQNTFSITNTIKQQRNNYQNDAQKGKTVQILNNNNVDNNVDQEEMNELIQINRLNIIYLDTTLSKQKKQIEIYNLTKQNTLSNLYLKAYGDILLQNQNYESAKSQYFDIYTQNQNNRQFNWNLAKCFFELGSKECIIYFGKCVELDTDSARKRKTLKNICQINQYLSKQEKNIKVISIPSTDKNKILKIVTEAKKALNI